MKTGRPRIPIAVGTTFGNLLVIGISHVSDKQVYYRCACSCGNETACTGGNLRAGRSKSCGCRQGGVMHGHASPKKLGSKHSPEYNTWLGMIQRCHNPNNKYYGNYGGRGIVVCERWRKFVNFLDDMQCKPSPKHSIDRIDNNGNYEPGNCRWATRREQNLNRRNTIFVAIGGVAKTIPEWCEYYDITQRMVRSRMYRSLTTAEAILAAALARNGKE